jgi:hypothetical protein
MPECEGRAKHASGHITIDDAITLRSRSDESSWNAEMLCLRPSTTDMVFPEFDRSLHISAFDITDPSSHTWIAGMDFGFRAPTAILFAALDGSGFLRIVAERIATGIIVADHARAILESPWPTPVWLGVDPAGEQASDQTGHSSIKVLRDAGLVVRTRRAPIEAGLRAIRARLRPATGTPTIAIHPRCAKLIEAIETYHYPENKPHTTTPEKNGPDHAIDALRYLILNLDNPWKSTMTRYT